MMSFSVDNFRNSSPFYAAAPSTEAKPNQTKADFDEKLARALADALHTAGLDPSSVHIERQGTDSSGDPRQIIISLDPPNQAARAEASTSLPTPSAYRNDIGAYNSYQYATDTTAADLAKALGATVTQTRGVGPTAAPEENLLIFKDGFAANAGLLEHNIELFGKDFALQLLATEHNAYLRGGSHLALNENPALATYQG